MYNNDNYYCERVGSIILLKNKDLDNMLKITNYKELVDNITKWNSKPNKCTIYFVKYNVNIVFYFNNLKIVFNSWFTGDMKSVAVFNSLLGNYVRHGNYLVNPNIDSLDNIQLSLLEYKYISR